MNATRTYVATGMALFGYLLMAWFLGSVLRLRGADLWVLRGGLAVLGLAGAGAFLWLRGKQQAAQPVSSSTAAPAAGASGGDELDLLLREAEGRLAASRLAQGARLGNLPVIFLIGGAGAGKSSSVVHSGVEPDLLAGQVFQENVVIPTRLLNLWFARQAVFVEVSSKILADPRAWTRLVQRMRPGRLQSVASRQQAPRAVVVCIECKSFLKPGAAEAASAEARNLWQRLTEISRFLGVSVPVYVLFTKMDRLAFFEEYVQNLTHEEVNQVLGVTLPMQPPQPTGVYAEQATARLSAAFHNLFYSLSDKRTEFLSRENDKDRLPGIYEFPRELRKLRSSMVQFLVDLCRPSQLTVGPFLRGFYFCGVRPIFVKDVVEAPVRRPEAPKAVKQRDATGMFRTLEDALAPQAPQPAAPAAGTRRAPQRVFLQHVFTDVLLNDRLAWGASGASVRTNATRRILLASAAALCVLLSIAFLVSFIRNRSLISDVRNASEGISAAEAGGANLPSADAVRRLDTLRQSIQTLAFYDREGAPWSLRWGLYAGSEVYPEARRIYFRRFHQLLFGSTQAGLLNTLRGLPGVPGQGDDYGFAYDTLKGYLITTSNHDKSTRMFLSPLLRTRWAAGRDIDAERMRLAEQQFDFYSEELKFANPFSNESDGLAVERARRYLSQFAGAERVYRFMLAEAGKDNRPINFNQQFPGSAEVVVNNREVPGAFSKGGWNFMQNAIKNADRFFSGEQWVLGQQSGGAVDRAKLEQELRARYSADFVGTWRDFLKKSIVVRYVDTRDATRKLNTTSSQRSPLLALFWVASQNTNVDAPDVVRAFKPLHAVMPPSSTDQYIGPSNAEYMKALLTLQVSLEQAVGQPGGINEPSAAQTLSNASSAKLVTRQIAQSFGLDQEAHLETTVQKLMEDPITYTEALLRGLGPAELNGKGRELCAQFRLLMGKFPFQPNAPARATLEDVNAIFKPQQGAMWTFYEQNLKKFLARQGNLYAPVAGGGITLTPSFVGFFNRAATFSGALYPGGAAEPKLTYSLKPGPSEDIESLQIVLNGQAAEFAVPAAAARQFAWPGAGPHGVKLIGKFKGGSDFSFPSYDGLWAVFEFFWDADKWQPIAGGGSLEWMLRGGRQGRPVTSPRSGQPLVVRFDLDMGGAPPVFQKGYFSGLACVSDVAR